MYSSAFEDRVSGSAIDREERAALLAAWAQHRQRLYCLCLRWVGGDPDDAGDALSQVALRAIEDHAARSAGVTNYGGWLTRLAWNLCMDIHRERAFRRRTLERFAREGLLHVAPAEDHPEAGHIHRELGQRIQEAIDDLPPRLRAPCQRRFVDDMPYEQIAAELGLTNDTVRKRIQQARDILCKRLSADACDDAPPRSTVRRCRRPEPPTKISRPRGRPRYLRELRVITPDSL